MPKRIINNKGVTFIELLISVAVIGLLVGLVGVFLIGTIKNYRLSMAKGEVQREARVATDLINRNLRQAYATSVIITRFNANQPPCSMAQFTQINGKEYRFYQLGDKLYMGSRPAAGTWSDNIIGDKLRVALFSYPRTDDDAIMSISLSFERQTYEKQSKTIQLSVEKVRIMN